MTGTLAWGIAFGVLCLVAGMLIGWPLGDRHGQKRAAEEAEDAAAAAVVDAWKGLPDEDGRPSPPWPPAPPQAPPAGRGKHRHPAGPRHTALPVAGYLPAPDGMGPWNGQITVPAPVQQPPWEAPLPEPQTEVLEPTAADCLRPDALTDTGWTRQMAADMDQFIAGLIGATDKTLKEITGGAR